MTKKKIIFIAFFMLLIGLFLNINSRPNFSPILPFLTNRLNISLPNIGEPQTGLPLIEIKSSSTETILIDSNWTTTGITWNPSYVTSDGNTIKLKSYINTLYGYLDSNGYSAINCGPFDGEIDWTKWWESDRTPATNMGFYDNGSDEKYSSFHTNGNQFLYNREAILNLTIPYSREEVNYTTINVKIVYHMHGAAPRGDKIYVYNYSEGSYNIIANNDPYGPKFNPEPDTNDLTDEDITVYNNVSQTKEFYEHTILWADQFIHPTDTTEAITIKQTHIGQYPEGKIGWSWNFIRADLNQSRYADYSIVTSPEYDFDRLRTIENITYWGNEPLHINFPSYKTDTSLQYRIYNDDWSIWYPIANGSEIGQIGSKIQWKLNLSSEPEYHTRTPVIDKLIIYHNESLVPTPPAFINIYQNPFNDSVDYHDTVKVSTVVESVIPNLNVTLNYTTTNWATFTLVNMSLGTNPYFTFHGNIPPFSYLTLVKYKCFAISYNGTHYFNSTSSEFNYTVRDLTPPYIEHYNNTISTSVGLTPSYQPYPDENTVRFYATITDEITSVVLSNISFHINWQGVWNQYSISNPSGNIYRYTFSNFDTETGFIKVNNNGKIYYYWNATDNHNNTAIANYTIRLDEFAPEIETIWTEPEIPQYFYFVYLYCNISEANTIEQVKILYSIDNWATNSSQISMSFMSGKTYRVMIPRQDYDTTVKYEIYTKDTFSGHTHGAYIFPENEKYTYGQYYVSDDIPPTILPSPIFSFPEIDKIGRTDFIIINFLIIEPTGSSGVREVYLHWINLLGIEQTLLMTPVGGGLYTAVIYPQFIDGNIVLFDIVAYDNAGNVATFGPLPIEITYIGAVWNPQGLAAWIIIPVIGVVLIYTTRKRTKEPINIWLPVVIGIIIGIFIAYFIAIGFYPMNLEGISWYSWVQNAIQRWETWAVILPILTIFGILLTRSIIKIIQQSTRATIKL